MPAGTLESGNEFGPRVPVETLEAGNDATADGTGLGVAVLPGAGVVVVPGGGVVAIPFPPGEVGAAPFGTGDPPTVVPPPHAARPSVTAPVDVRMKPLRVMRNRDIDDRDLMRNRACSKTEHPALN